jgi:hypothetical protein
LFFFSTRFFYIFEGPGHQVTCERKNTKKQMKKKTKKYAKQRGNTDRKKRKQNSRI